VGVATMNKWNRHGNFGALRAVCAIPAVCGSVLVLTAAFGWLGVWANLLLAGWLLIAAALLCRPVERAAVLIACRYRGVSPREAAVLDPLRRQAVQRCGLADESIDLYVRRSSPGVNGYAAGRWSVAVSGGLIQACEDGRLGDQGAVAVLTHEVAHHLGQATRYGLTVGWLTAPWRAVAVVFGGLLRSIVRRLPTARSALLLVPLVGAVAAVQMVQHHAWLSLSVLVGLALVAWVQPLADAAVCWASERAADAYTVKLGTGADLAKVVESFHSGDACGRWRASHPSLASRLEQLAGVPRRDERAVACTRTHCGWWRNTASFPPRVCKSSRASRNEAAFDHLAVDKTAV
jgi:Zn-dependent protease with chaperone function